MRLRLGKGPIWMLCAGLRSLHPWHSAGLRGVGVVFCYRDRPGDSVDRQCSPLPAGFGGGLRRRHRVFLLMELLCALPGFPCALAVGKRAAGLALAPRKTAVLPAWRPDLDQTKVDMLAVSGAGAVMQVVAHFRYLGVEAGPGSYRVRWEAPLSNFPHRAAGICQARGWFSERARVYGRLAFGVLAFIAPFDRPPAGASQVETPGIARALGAPMHSMLADVLASLPDFGLPRLVPHLGAS